MKKATAEERQEYLDGLYTKEEQEQIRTSLKKYKEMQSPQDFKKVLSTALRDYLLLDEEYRLVKKHLNISEEQTREIVKKHRIRSKGEEELLEILHPES